MAKDFTKFGVGRVLKVQYFTTLLHLSLCAILKIIDAQNLSLSRRLITLKYRQRGTP